MTIARVRSLNFLKANICPMLGRIQRRRHCVQVAWGPCRWKKYRSYSPQWSLDVLVVITRRLMFTIQVRILAREDLLSDPDTGILEIIRPPAQIPIERITSICRTKWFIDYLIDLIENSCVLDFENLNPQSASQMENMLFWNGNVENLIK